MEERLKELICEYADIKPEDLNEDTNIRTGLSLDSISLVNLAVAIEGEFDLEISDRDIIGIETFGDVVNLIKENT